MHAVANRRKHTRYALSPMYTGVGIRFLESEKYAHEGHAYNVSAGGVQFELDRPIDPGTPVAMRLTLPNGNGIDLGPGRAIFVFATIVWLDETEPGPVRMAAVFTAFTRAGDAERLAAAITSGRYAIAA